MAAKNFMNHFVLIATAIFAICGFILEIVGLSIRQDNTNYNRKNPLGLQWLFFVFYFVTIAAFLACIWKSVVDGYRLLLLALCSIAFVFTVLDCEWALNVGRAVIDPDNGGDVHTAGLILMGISFITWVIVLGAAHNSGLARAADLTLPTHRPGRTQPTHEKETQPVMTQKAAAGAAAENTTKHTTNTHTTATHPAYAETNTTTTTVPPPPAHHGEAVAETEVPGATTKVITMFSYDANPDDPQEMSFAKNEVLEILDNRGQWWTARRTAADGNTTTGLVPRNYVTPI